MAEVRELRYFVAVYEARSLTAAARRCFVSQPSVSAAIASLEAELETSLFDRHRKGATPTAAAEQLYPTAKRLVDETQGLRSLLVARAASRRITLGLMRTLDIARTLEAIAPLAHAPHAHLRLVAEDERCDARIVARAMVTRDEAFVPMWKERFVVALPAAHPLARKRTLKVQDLVDVGVISRCHCEYAPKFARQLKKLEVVAIAQSEEWALALVGAGVGICLVPEGTVRDRVDVVTRAIAGVNASREVGLAYGARTAPPPEIAALAARLRQRARR
jgi:DNA-binding transcriptional LysR family regulator